MIPLELRLQIESGSWLHTKLVLTLLISFRAMIIPPVLKTKSITAPFNGNSETLPIYEVKEGFKALGISLPRKLIPGDLLNIVKSSPGGVFSTLHAPMDALVFSRQARHLLEPFKVLSDYSGSLLYYDLLRESRLADILMVNKNRHYIGKLSRKLEAAGKVRLFAMVDVWTQSILKPYHNEIFNVLKCIVTDGTFDQDKPIKALQKVLKNRPNDQYVASFDLSSATDRLPIKLQMQV